MATSPKQRDRVRDVMAGAFLNLETPVAESSATRHALLPVADTQVDPAKQEEAKTPKTNDANAAFAEQNSLPETSLNFRPDGVSEARIMEGTAKRADASKKVSQNSIRGMDPS